jgi:hypothetical protein
MRSPIPTYDFASNAPEHIQRDAKAVGRSQHKRAVFEQVYYHKAIARTAREIAQKTGLTLVQVQKVGSVLDGIAFDKVKHNGQIAYARRREIHAHKREILERGVSREKRDAGHETQSESVNGGQRFTFDSAEKPPNRPKPPTFLKHQCG